jgi:hypothetical protein
MKRFRSAGVEMIPPDAHAQGMVVVVGPDVVDGPELVLVSVVVLDPGAVVPVTTTVVVVAPRVVVVAGGVVVGVTARKQAQSSVHVTEGPQPTPESHPSPFARSTTWSPHVEALAVKLRCSLDFSAVSLR